MTRKSILYLGPNSGTSRHRIGALERLGHSVTVVEPHTFLPSSWLIERWLWEVGSDAFQKHISKEVIRAIGASTFDVGLIDGGRLVGAGLVRQLRKVCNHVVNYNIDDPFGKRDKNNWRLYLKTVPFYDLVVVMRDCNVQEAIRRGAQKVLKVSMSADEVAHEPRVLTEDDRLRWSTDVLFVGTWMPERGPFLSRLMELGVPLAIFGNRWQKAPEWPKLRPAWRGPALSRDDDYAKAIQCAKVSLGLLSKGNRDLSTTRSFEIPHLTGVFCGERTSEHAKFYREHEEAIFWDTPEECADGCKRLLNNTAYREELGRRARLRCIANGTMNEKVLGRIIETIYFQEASERAIAAGSCVV